MLNRMTRWMETVEPERVVKTAGAVLGAAGLAAITAAYWLN